MIAGATATCGVARSPRTHAAERSAINAAPATRIAGDCMGTNDHRGLAFASPWSIAKESARSEHDLPTVSIEIEPERGLLVIVANARRCEPWCGDRHPCRTFVRRR